MATVKNLSKETITTITAGNIVPDGQKSIADWEAPIVVKLHGKKVEVCATPEQQKKKGKK